jgi:branched-chain amino acid transport system substrate-binding protein
MAEKEPKTYSRREFLKIAGATGAAVGLSAGLGGALAACEDEETTTTSADATKTSGPAKGREIKVGFVTPITGALANFGVADDYCVEKWNEAVSGGLVCGDGKSHPIKIILADSQSDTNRAAQVAGDLALNEGVDIMMAASTPETVMPVADQCEALEVPCFSGDCPWQPYYFGRGATPDTPFKWTYNHFWGSSTSTCPCGMRWKPTRLSRACGPTTPMGTRSQIPTPVIPPLWRQPGTRSLILAGTRTWLRITRRR